MLVLTRFGPWLALALYAVGLNAQDGARAEKSGAHLAPYPPSPVIEKMEVDFSTHRRLAPGSDNWPLTWADDDNQYTAWGDGGGFGGTNSKGRVTLGVARVSGGPDSHTGTNVWGGFAAENAAQFEGKSYGILALADVLYMWVLPQPGPHLRECRLARSSDHGATWEQADWAFKFSEGLTIPTFLNFGRGYAGARDAFVYSYFIEPTWGPGSAQEKPHKFDVHRPGRVHLARAPRDGLFDRGKFEFFAGLDGKGGALWTRDIGERKPVLTDPNGVGWNLSASFNAGLGRCLLATEHGETHAGKMGLFDAPEPWGPWTTVAYEDNWGDGHIEVTTFLWTFPTKWMSADGTSFTLVFTGKNSNDSWNTVSGRFVPRSK